MAEERIAELKVAEVTDAVEQLLHKSIADLKGSTKEPAAGETRLFFPNGIELISVTAKIGPADVAVTIAGEKGIKDAETELFRINATRDHHRNVGDGGDSEEIHHNERIIWENDNDFPIRIAFNINGCPLDKCDFTVSDRRPVLTTVSPNSDAPYDYKYSRYLHEERIVDGDPKIIIR